MNDEKGHTNYHAVSQPRVTHLPPDDPGPLGAVGPTGVPDRVFGAIANVDGTDLVFDETNSMWVHSYDHDEPWLGDTPDQEPEVPIEADKEEVRVDDLFVRVNVAPAARLRLRKKPNASSDILGSITDGTVLHVVDGSNPEWPLVEVELNGNTVRGYVKSTCVTSTTSSNE